MSEYEVARNIKEHFKAMEQQNGCKTTRDLYWAIKYVEDFLLVSRNKAIAFLEENVLQCSFEKCKKEWKAKDDADYNKKHKRARRRCHACK